ncbi:hypothetical protein MNBD_GAMMA16-987 [hydrothermal vent metagenome]|uniref:Inner membrane protein YjeT (Clustered with HflC) n=1 Tax=hydrothermal vent metagenome TaxID=652676 RepID=A0A3B0YSA5_9ZZZZ
MWTELWTAIALLLVIEGIIPFLSPHIMRQALVSMLSMDDNTLRISGLVSMVAGAVLLYILK